MSEKIKTLQECKEIVAREDCWTSWLGALHEARKDFLDNIVDRAAELYASQFKSSPNQQNSDSEFFVRDQIVYLNEGILHKTPCDDPNELSVVLISKIEREALSELVAELHSLKMSINESPLNNYFPKKKMSFHDKCILAIHKLCQSVSSPNQLEKEIERLRQEVIDLEAWITVVTNQRDRLLAVTQTQEQSNTELLEALDKKGIVNRGEIIKLINSHWRFDDNQMHLSTWHDKQDLIEIIQKL